LVVAGLLAFASAAQAQSRAGSSVRRGNHVAVARSARSSGGGSFRYVHSSLGRLPGSGNHGLSSNSSNRSAHTRSALSRAANALKSQQHRSGASATSGTAGGGTSGTGGTAGSGTTGSSGDPFAAVDASAGAHHRSRKDKASGSSGSSATSGTTAGTASGTAASGGKKCAAKTSGTTNSGTTTGTTTGTTAGTTTGTTTGTTGTTAGTTTSGLMANQGLGNNGTLQKAFMVKFSYTPNDQNSHSVVVSASSREEAKEKVLARHPHAVFRSVVRI
jgi:hypothetical protein